MSAAPLSSQSSQIRTEAPLEVPSRAKVRVGLMVRSSMVPRWVASLAKRITDSSYAELALVVIDRRLRSQVGKQVPLPLRAWGAVDRRLNARDEDAFETCDLVPSLRRVPVVVLETIEPGAIPMAIGSAQLHVLLAIDGTPESESFSSWAKFGTWFLVGNRLNRESLSSSLRAAWKGRSVALTTLAAVDAEGHADVLAHSYSATNEISPYLGDTTDSRKSAEMVLRAFQELQCYGWDHVRSRGNKQGDSRVFREDQAPEDLNAARFITRWVAKTTQYKLNKAIRKEQWFVSYRENTGKLPLSSEQMRDFRTIIPPRDRFYADPFLFERNGRHYLFFEDYRYSLKKGLIAFAEIGSDGQFGEPEVVLDLPYHLSYPTLIEHEGECFLIPETAANRTVEAYRALDFPRKWALEKVLLQDVPAIDPTVFMHEGRTWLFVSGMVDGGSTNDELFLFSAEDLFGEWEPHPRNPVISDVRRARPAGSVFLHDGNLIRPSQDCSGCYGSAVVFNRIDTLSITDYAETPIGRIGPEWYPKNLGTHTFNQTARFQVVDGRVLRFK